MRPLCPVEVSQSFASSGRCAFQQWPRSWYWGWWSYWSNVNKRLSFLPFRCFDLQIYSSSGFTVWPPVWSLWAIITLVGPINHRRQMVGTIHDSGPELDIPFATNDIHGIGRYQMWHKHELIVSSQNASLPCARWPVDHLHKGTVTWKSFPCHDVIKYK